MAREYTHLLIHRTLGTLRVPPWLDEGLAMLSGSRCSPFDLPRYARIIRATANAGNLLDLATIIDGPKFYADVKTTAVWGGQDPYAQGFSTVRFLYNHVGDEGLRNMIDGYNESGDLDKAFTAVYSGNVDQLYQDWRKALTGK